MNFKNVNPTTRSVMSMIPKYHSQFHYCKKCIVCSRGAINFVNRNKSANLSYSPGKYKRYETSEDLIWILHILLAPEWMETNKRRTAPAQFTFRNICFGHLRRVVCVLLNVCNCHLALIDNNLPLCYMLIWTTIACEWNISILWMKFQ